MGTVNLLRLFVAVSMLLSFAMPMESWAVPSRPSAKPAKSKTVVKKPVAKKHVKVVKKPSAKASVQVAKKPGSKVSVKVTKKSLTKTKVASRASKINGAKNVKVAVAKSKKMLVLATNKKTRLAAKRGKTVVALHRYSGKKIASAKVAKTKYAYPAGLFMWSGPQYAGGRLSSAVSDSVSESFDLGFADRYSPKQLVQAGVFEEQPLLGGIFRRREQLRFLIIHSTETGRPADGPRVIKSWNRGMRHPGAQFVVDRDGKIYQTVDPDLATVHVNIFRTKLGVNNDNSIGIEIVRAGKQKYTKKQLASVTKLSLYLQNRYDIDDTRVLGHGQVQPSDRLDPVGFDWTEYKISKSVLKAQALVVQRKSQSFMLAGEPRKTQLEVDTESVPESYSDFRTAWNQPIRLMGNIGLLMHRLSLLLVVK